MIGVGSIVMKKIENLPEKDQKILDILRRVYSTGYPGGKNENEIVFKALEDIKKILSIRWANEGA